MGIYGTYHFYLSSFIPFICFITLYNVLAFCTIIHTFLCHLHRYNSTSTHLLSSVSTIYTAHIMKNIEYYTLYTYSMLKNGYSVLCQLWSSISSLLIFHVQIHSYSLIHSVVFLSGSSVLCVIIYLPLLISIISNVIVYIYLYNQ